MKICFDLFKLFVDEVINWIFLIVLFNGVGSFWIFFFKLFIVLDVLLVEKFIFLNIWFVLFNVFIWLMVLLMLLVINLIFLEIILVVLLVKKLLIKDVYMFLRDWLFFCFVLLILILKFCNFFIVEFNFCEKLDLFSIIFKIKFLLFKKYFFFFRI